MKKIYLDTVSTTRPDPAVIKTYEDLLEKTYVNSDALYDDGVTLYNLQEDARKRVASLLGVSAEEVIVSRETIVQKFDDNIAKKRDELNDLIVKRDTFVKYFGKGTNTEKG